ncbi:hypothetical protein MXD63_44640, partial [Frankia sp. Cpl3]|nr:hypothetical protein [Frankia sp. Cpl3]
WMVANRAQTIREIKINRLTTEEIRVKGNSLARDSNLARVRPRHRKSNCRRLRPEESRPRRQTAAIDATNSSYFRIDEMFSTI